MIPDFSSYLHPYKRGLTAPQMEINALVIGTYLRSIGWSFNAMAAALGNWEAECKLNPNLPTNKKFPANQTGAFGLPQWNPWAADTASIAGGTASPSPHPMTIRRPASSTSWPTMSGSAGPEADTGFLRRSTNTAGRVGNAHRTARSCWLRHIIGSTSAADQGQEIDLNWPGNGQTF